MEKTIKLKKAKRARKHGFRRRQEIHSGKKILKRRRMKKRKILTV